VRRAARPPRTRRTRRPAAEATPAAPARRERRYQERDRRIREAAQRLLLERGLHGFSMDDVAAAIDYSKGTVYHHYASKEDALVASCADSCGELAAAFESAAALPGSSRARMAAIAESYCRFVREREVQFRTIPLLHAPTVLEKVEPARRDAMEAARGRCLAVCAGIVRDAVAAGDLPRGVRPEIVTFGLWALMFGAFMLAELHRPQGILGIADPTEAIRACWAAHMDGLGWKAAPGGAPGRRQDPRRGRRHGQGSRA
jgi:AcrR family transcriptional regulator